MPSLVINGALAVLSPVAWLMLALRVGGPHRLAARGRESLKYFTVLSNLLSGFTSLAYLISCLTATRATTPAWLLSLKLMATSAVMLTFITVILLLGPKFGWASMYSGGNLWMHLVLPLLAAIDCMLFVPIGTLPFVATLAAMLPCILYGIGYLRAIVRHGAAQGDRAYDFYGFLRWGKQKVPLVMAGMLSASWALGIALWLASKALCPA